MIKALIKSYNLATKSFHRWDGTILYSLDHASFFEVFRLDGALSEPVDLVDLQEKFEINTKAYTRNSMLQHIPMDLKKVGDFHKKLEKKMHFDKFKNYFMKTVYCVHKVVGIDGTNMVYGA